MFTRTLYHYTKYSTFEKYYKSFLKGEIKLNSWKSTNDPMEGFFTYNPRENIREMVVSIKNQKAGYSIACFSAVYNNYLMWSHYADGHGGVCLEYQIDKKKLPRNCQIQKVTYNDQIPKFDHKIGSKKNCENFLLTKSTLWKYEEEYRLLCCNNSCSRLIKKVGKVTGVIFGVKYEKCDPGDKFRRLLLNYIETKKSVTIQELYEAKIADTMTPEIKVGKYNRHI